MRTIRKEATAPDLALLSITLLLIFSGILILASVSASFSLEKTGTTFYFLKHQMLFGMLPGLILALIAYLMPIGYIRKLSVFALLGNIVLLGLVFLPVIGTTSGAHRWLFVGPFSFQPAELLKITFILYLASWLATHIEERRGRKTSKFLGANLFGKKKREWQRTLLPFGIILGTISLFLIMQPDISTLGVIGLTSVFMYFLAGTPLWHTGLFILTGIGGLYSLIQIAPYRLSRLAVFLNPDLDPLGQGYQIKQALIGIGSGGLTGVGLGLSFQKFGILPEPISDSIFAVFSEELGFIGAIVLISLFVAFVWRSFTVAKRVENRFEQLAVVGIAAWITMQAFINMGAMMGLLPLTGIPLPFISYGGSSTIAISISLGMMLSFTRKRYGKEL